MGGTERRIIRYIDDTLYERNHAGNNLPFLDTDGGGR